MADEKVPTKNQDPDQSAGKNIDNEDLEALKKKAEALKVPYLDLTGKEIPVEVLKEIPEEAAAFYGFVPVSKQENVLEVGMLNPENLKARDALRFIVRSSGLESKIHLISPTGLKNILKQYRSFRGEVKKALKELEQELEEKEKTKLVKVTEEVKSIAAEAPITKIVAVILKQAIEGNASDIHIEPGDSKTKVRFRIDGSLLTSLLLPKEVHASVISRIKILSHLKIDETRVPQDGRFSTTVGQRKIDFRVSTFPTSGGEKVVLRVLDPATELDDFSKLGVEEYNREILEKAIKQPFGTVLISGPTGSGKTTTLYTILSKLNDEKVNIVSLEDPVEYYINGVSQSQIRPEIGYTFASGLRHILRQDPDIIMVGEIRDEETASLAVHAALTGHILLSTIHTNNAIGVIPRLVDMKISPFLLPSSLNLAMAQRLTRRLCDKCKKETEAPKQENDIIEEELNQLSPEQRKRFPWEKPFKVYRPTGCKHCGNKGTKGRIALFEMLEMTPELEEIINTSLTEGKILEEAKRQNMITMRQDGVYKVLQGLITFEEMMRVVEE
ncbi:MAG: GspE/PulE family protein [Candidatus Portnoybacteria bacterium]